MTEDETLETLTSRKMKRPKGSQEKRSARIRREPGSNRALGLSLIASDSPGIILIQMGARLQGREKRGRCKCLF